MRDLTPMQRRTFFKLGLASAALLAVAGGLALQIKPGLESDGRLSISGRTVFTAVVTAILDSSLSPDKAVRQQSVDSLLSRIDALVQALPPHAQTELSQLLALLATDLGRNTLAGLNQPWPEATVAVVQQSLESMRFSSLAVRQQAYGALHDITAAAFFSDSANWPLLGYPGPMAIG